jgi:uncharacterized protein involved in exopolysaccharide biosynthesis
MTEQSITHIQILSSIYVIKKHKWKIFLLFLAAVITVAVGSLMATPIYRASSQLLVKPGREDVYVAPTATSPTVIERSYEGQKVNAEISIMKSQDLVAGLVDRIGLSTLYGYPDRTLKSKILKSKILKSKILKSKILKSKILKETNEREFPPLEIALRSVYDSLEVSAVPKSNVIEVAFEWPDPVLAARAVNTFVELYLDQHLKVHANPQTYELVGNQARKWEQELRKAEKDLEAFKRRHSITSLPEQKTILLGRLSEAETETKQTETEIQETLQLVYTLQAQLQDLEQDIQLQETVNKQSETLAALKEKLVELELQGLKEEIKRVKEMIAEEEKKEQKTVVSGKSPIRQELEGDLLKAKAQLRALMARQESQNFQTATYQSDLETLNRLEKELNELERKVKINEANYQLYLTKFEEAKISENMDKQKIANVRVIQPALPIMKPVEPRIRLNVIIGAFLGLCAGIGLALLSEFIHPVFRTREDVEQFLGLRVLATLPKEKKS